MRKYFGVARENVSTGMKRFLVQRCGTNSVDLPPLSQLNGASQVLISRVAADRREPTPRQPFGNELQINAIGAAEPEFRIGRIVDGVDRQLRIDYATGLTQASSIADDQRPTAIVQFGVAKALHDDLR